MSRYWKCGWLAAMLAVAVAWPVAAADEKPAAEKPDAEKPAEKDPYAVPEGTPKELIDYIKGLAQTPPRDAESLKKTRQAILQAAEKALAGKPNDEEMEFAAQAKMNMLETPEQLADFAAELKKGGHDKLARQVRGFALQVDLRKCMMGGAEKRKKAIEDAVKFVDDGSPQPTDISLAMMAGRIAEMSGDNDLAVKTYQSLGKAFAGSDDEHIAQFGKLLDGVVRRLSLLGNKMVVEGKTLAGNTFDWTKYEGKVVLVDFWATWAGPSIGELPAMKKCYELYHNKGFEIVGLSCDRSRDELEKFVKEKDIPWTILFGDNGPSPTVEYYGVTGIPTRILVDKEGKVVSLTARGEQLRKELEKLLGPAEEKKGAKEGEGKKDSTSPP